MKKINKHQLNYLIAVLLSVFSLLKTNTCKAQIINETFEEPAWTSQANAAVSATTGQVTITATSASNTISYFVGTGSTTTSSINTTPNSGTWWFNKASALTTSCTRLGRVHSIVTGFGLSSGGYLITPVINGGVSSVTFWMTSSAPFAIGINTNTTSSQPTYASTGSNTIGGYTFLSQAFPQSGTAGNTTMQQFSFTTSFNGPCRVGFFSLGNSGISLDDIVINEAPAPTTQVSNIVSSNISGTSMTLGVTRGNGYGVAIFMKVGTGTITNPSDNTTYNAAAFGSGSQLGSSGYYCVYRGSDASAVNVTGLSLNTSYTIQAFEYNGGNGSEKYNISTATNNPTTAATSGPTIGSVTTTATSNITGSTVQTGGEVVSDGGATITERGIVFSTSLNPTITDTKVIDAVGGTGTFISNVSGLAPSTNYHVRAYAINNIGPAYGADIAFSTLQDFRSATSGNWGDITTWEVFNGTTWNAATVVPTTADGAVTIMSGHNVAVAASISADDVTVAFGGTLTVNNGVTLTVNNGSATNDIMVNGKLVNAGTITATGVLRFSSVGEYQHTMNGGTIPTSTWDDGSKTTINGTTATAPGGRAQNFSNFIYDCGSSTANIVLGVASPGFQTDTLIVKNTGVGSLQLASSNNQETVTVNYYLQTGGSVNIINGLGGSGGASRNFDVNGDFIINATTTTTSLFNILSFATGSESKIANIRVAGNMTIGSGATITRSNATGVIGGITNIVFDSTGNNTFTNDGLFVGNINIEVAKASGGSVTLAGTGLPLLGALTLTSGIFNSTGLLTLKSTIDQTARIAPVGAGTITGNVSVERYVPGGRRAFRFLAHPFNAAMPLSQITDDIDITGNPSDAVGGFTASGTNNPSAFYYDPTTGTGNTTNDITGWKPYTAAVNTVGVGEGYRVLVRGAKGNLSPATPAAVTLNTTGSLNASGDFVKSLSYTIGLPSFNLIGNPYAAPVNVKTLTKTASINANYWIWNAQAGTSGAYVNRAFATDNYNLPSSGSFFVQTTAIGQTITFKESDKAIVDSPMLRQNPIKGIVELTVEGNNTQWDRFALYFDKKGNTGTDIIWDGSKMRNSEVNLYSINTDKKALSIDVRPFSADMVIPMGFTSDKQRTYAITASNINLDGSNALYLKDKYLATETLLTTGAVYEFNTDANPASQGEQRFELVAKKSLPIAVTEILNITLAPNPAKESVKVSFSHRAEQPTVIRLINSNGVCVKTINVGTTQKGQIAIDVKGFAKGIYNVQLLGNKEIKTTKLTIQ